MSVGNIGQQIINGTYGLDNRPSTAYEELKIWCAKHLGADDYKVVPESRTYATTIYFTDCGVGFISFDRDGDVCGIGALDEDDMFEHINEIERAERN